jgi:S-adenosylmethionine/arginine decarboxylase-like enzyme
VKQATTKPAIPAQLTSHHFSAVLPLTDERTSLEANELLSILKSAVTESELTVVADVTASFTPTGSTAVVVLAESHVAVHLWPELGLATVDIHVCDYSGDNESKAKRLAQLLGEKLANDTSSSLWKQLTTSSAGNPVNVGS